MRYVLVVANQTLGGEGLLTELRDRVARGPCHFHVLVPASGSRDHMTWDEEEAGRWWSQHHPLQGLAPDAITL